MKNFKHQFTLFYIIKAALCFAGFLYLLVVEGQTSNPLAMGAILSVIAAPFVARLESSQRYIGERETTTTQKGA
ncbi:hypothetical protein B9Z44_14540 [Limnohabitans curvus]|uniref:Uncharacterized protein n=1 Tax=Limnohabitans curvus TaxID=323423 RepID=A0A315EGN6_9BURK|nr:hypothetical protein [Limnohabitans curvus]PUE56461.1 hypothetical protein B9Z44_14540 [Limnohabitans curvus]